MITSAANPIVKRMRLLADRRYRRAEAAAVVHGIQPIWQAAEAGYELLVVGRGRFRTMEGRGGGAGRASQTHLFSSSPDYSAQDRELD